MGSKALSDTAVRNFKPKAKPFKVADGGGLFIMVTPKGGKLWRWAYRFANKQQTLALGTYPAVALADARKERELAKTDLAAGRNPAVEYQERKRAAARGSTKSFAKVAEAWLESRKPSWSAGHYNRVKSSIENRMVPEFGHMSIDLVQSDDVLAAIRKRFEKIGSIEMGRRTRAYVEDIFEFAKAEKLIRDASAADILPALSKPKKKKNFAKFKPHELPSFLHKLGHYEGDRRTALAVRFTLLTMVRTTETRFAKLSEFEDWQNGDASKALWRLSPERMKMDREHLVPLSKQAINCLREIKSLTGNNDLIFASKTRSGVISENCMLFALYSMGYKGKATIHGLRGTASTVLNEHDFNNDWIEFQLAHDEEDEVRASYNSAEWLPQRRKMMQWWADYLDQAEDSVDLIG